MSTSRLNASSFMRAMRARLFRPRKSGKLRVLYIVSKYPEFSETYMHEEIASLWDDCKVKIINYMLAEAPRGNGFPHEYLPYKDASPAFAAFQDVNLKFNNAAQLDFLRALDPIIRDFQPDVIHAHYLPNAMIAGKLAQIYKVPFTIRTHSFDMLQKEPARRVAMCKFLRSRFLMQIFTFPAHVDFFLTNGIPKNKVTASWPIVNVHRFLNEAKRTPTQRIMCAGPCVIKKAHSEFIDLAKLMQDQGASYEFTLKTKGNRTPDIEQYNMSLGSPVTISYSEPEEMPNVYQSHDWLVYPSDQKINEVGLPASIIEAQASGIGVAWQELPGRRSEQLEFLGGAGYLFRSICDVPDLLSRPYPDQMRQAGFRNALKCDVTWHKQDLMRVWLGEN